MLSYARRYAYCLVREDLSDLLLVSDYKRVHIMKALSALAKFLGGLREV